MNPLSEFASPETLVHGTELLTARLRHVESGAAKEPLPEHLPDKGMGNELALETLAPLVLGAARDLRAPGFFAHMDPPVTTVAAVTAFWNAALNQNMLHADTAPAARELEQLVMRWLLPFFDMRAGHMVPSSTIANLEAIWAAREMRDVEEVVASRAAHLSVAKAASLLGLKFRAVDTDDEDRIKPDELGDLSRSVLVLTAGTTAAGAIDPLDLGADAAWRHVDAAWAGPLRLSPHYSQRLEGIEGADSVAISAHKLLFQPKDSAMVLFADEQALEAISFSTAYLRSPNVGLMGSSSARGIPLLATLLAFGRAGLAQLIEHCMRLAEELAAFVESDSAFELFAPPQCGCLLWRARSIPSPILAERLSDAFVSTVNRGNDSWLRSVAANPFADPKRVFDAACAALETERRS